MTLLRRRILLFLFKVFDLMVMLFSLSMATGIGRLPEPAIPPSLDHFLLLESWPPNLFLLAGLCLAWHILFTFHSLYRSRRLLSRWHEIIEVVKATSLGTLVLLLILLILRKSVITPDFILTFWLIATGLTILSRLIMRQILALVRLRGHNLRFMLIVGTNSRAIELAERLKARKSLGYSIIGFVDDLWKGMTAVHKTELPIVSDLNSFPEYIRNNVVDEVMICLPMKSFYDQTLKIVTACEEQGLKAHFLPAIFDLKLAKSTMERFDGQLMISFTTGGMAGRWSLISKRALDIVVSALGLAAFSWLFGIVAVAIKATSPGPIFFIQDRVGLNKRRFKLYKFRTMIKDAEEKIKELEAFNEVSGPVFKIKDDPRITPLGKFLRKTSIDELPQFFNVLKGDMSLVGPRPLPVRDYQGFDQDWHRRRFSVRPGITCLWQVGGRNDIRFEQWMELDMRYIDQWSLKLDLMILLKTIPAVFKASGAA